MSTSTNFVLARRVSRPAARRQGAVLAGMLATALAVATAAFAATPAAPAAEAPVTAPPPTSAPSRPAAPPPAAPPAADAAGGPLEAVARRMDEAGRRLAAVDSGAETQDVQRGILALLDDLIRQAEQDASGQGQGQGQGQGAAQGQAAGAGRGPPQGTGRPASPATRSALVGGETARPHGLSQMRPADATDDWGRLKPRERQALLEAFQEMFPERYRDMLEAYYKSLSEAENRP